MIDKIECDSKTHLWIIYHRLKKCFYRVCCFIVKKWDERSSETWEWTNFSEVLTGSKTFYITVVWIFRFPMQTHHLFKVYSTPLSAYSTGAKVKPNTSNSLQQRENKQQCFGPCVDLCWCVQSACSTASLKGRTGKAGQRLDFVFCWDLKCNSKNPMVH